MIPFIFETQFPLQPTDFLCILVRNNIKILERLIVIKWQKRNVVNFLISNEKRLDFEIYRCGVLYSYKTHMCIKCFLMESPSNFGINRVPRSCL